MATVAESQYPLARGCLNRVIPLRFLVLTAHVVISILILWNLSEATSSGLTYCPNSIGNLQEDTRLLITLSFMLALLIFEFGGFLSGITMFSPAQSLFSIGAHAAATVTLAFFLFESWDCSVFLWVFGICSVSSFLTELITILSHTKKFFL